MKKLAEFFIDPETGLPFNVAIGEDLLPYEKGSQNGYGERFNVFVAKNSKFYHRSGCKCIKTRNAHIEHRYKAMSKYQPCQQCRPLTIIDYWYEKHITLPNEKSE